MRSLYEGLMALGEEEEEEEEREELLAEDGDEEEAKSDGYSYYDEGSDTGSDTDSPWTCSRFRLLVLIMVVFSSLVLGLGYLLAR